MKTVDYLKMLVEEFHSTTVATIGSDGHPQTRVIDIMLWDSEGVYFITAKGKAFYAQLMEQQYIALSAIRDKKSVSLRGKIRNIGTKRLNEVFEKNPYMQKIYPAGTRSAIEVFQLYEAEGEFFDISDPSNVTRESIVIGNPQEEKSGYIIGNECIGCGPSVGCGKCVEVCPQRCIDTSSVPAVIDQNHCLHCGNCVGVCPVGAVKRL